MDHTAVESAASYNNTFRSYISFSLELNTSVPQEMDGVDSI